MFDNIVTTLETIIFYSFILHIYCAFTYMYVYFVVEVPLYKRKLGNLVTLLFQAYNIVISY